MECNVMFFGCYISSGMSQIIEDTGTNYSYHACDIERCVEHLFDTPKFNLQNWNKKNWNKNLRLGDKV